ncbi:MAG: endo alpha-1,4 polygalactosaminidase [Candidatus Riflebacteria bacterium]|nr:endo alpha-1,4 polygalactosaminidase [Candidatus Riflebacteria bacterium]
MTKSRFLPGIVLIAFIVLFGNAGFLYSADAKTKMGERKNSHEKRANRDDSSRSQNVDKESKDSDEDSRKAAKKRRCKDKNKNRKNGKNSAGQNDKNTDKDTDKDADMDTDKDNNGSSSDTDSGNTTGTSTSDDVTVSAPTGNTMNFKGWGWTNRKPELSVLVDCDQDLLGLDQDDYDADEITQIKKNGARKVVSYLSIGEVEDWRSFFDQAKPLILSENSDWPGCFKLKYWDPRWLEILKKSIDQIHEKGFDGLYFDVVDAWEADVGTQQQMTDLLISVCQYIRSKNPSAIIIFQNSHRLFESQKLKNLVSGIVQEGLYASWDSDYTIQGEEKTAKINCFLGLRKEGKFVGLLEYTRDSEQMAQIRQEASKHGFLPYFSDKELDTLYPSK